MDIEKFNKAQEILTKQERLSNKVQHTIEMRDRLSVLTGKEVEMQLNFIDRRVIIPIDLDRIIQVINDQLYDDQLQISHLEQEFLEL